MRARGSHRVRVNMKKKKKRNRLKKETRRTQRVSTRKGGAGRGGKNGGCFPLRLLRSNMRPLSFFSFFCSFILLEAGRCPSFDNEELVLANGSGRTLCNAENFTFLSCLSPHPWVASSRSIGYLQAASPASGVPVHRALDPGGPGRGPPAWPPRRSFPPHAA